MLRSLGLSTGLRLLLFWAGKQRNNANRKTGRSSRGNSRHQHFTRYCVCGWIVGRVAGRKRPAAVNYAESYS
jgi:hypothetical protein